MNEQDVVQNFEPINGGSAKIIQEYIKSYINLDSSMLLSLKYDSNGNPIPPRVNVPDSFLSGNPTVQEMAQVFNTLLDVLSDRGVIELEPVTPT